MSEIKFRKGVPIPEEINYKGKFSDFGYAQMEVGDYNFIPKRTINSARNAASQYRNSEGGNACFNVVYKERVEVPEGGTEPVKGIAYWRVADYKAPFGGKKKVKNRASHQV
jgi:hypothetical protein